MIKVEHFIIYYTLIVIIKMLSLQTICYLILHKRNIVACDDIEFKYKLLMNILNCNFYCFCFYKKMFKNVIMHKISDFYLFEYNDCWIFYAVFNKFNHTLAKAETKYNNPKIIFNNELIKYQILDVNAISNSYLSIDSYSYYHTYLCISVMNNYSINVLVNLNNNICEQPSIIDNLLLKKSCQVIIYKICLNNNEYVKITVMK